MGLGYVVPSFALEITTTVCPFFRPLPSSSSSSCSSSSSSFSSFAIFSLASRSWITLSLSLFISVSLSRVLSFSAPRFTHVYIYIHAYRGRGVRYAKSLNTAVKCRRRVCQYGERGCHALFSPVPLRSYESASKIQILTLTLRPKCSSKPSSIVSLFFSR